MLRQQHENTLPSIAAFLPHAQFAAAAAAAIVAPSQPEAYEETAFKKSLKEAQIEGDCIAYYWLGVYFAQGYGTQKDEARAVDCYEKAMSNPEIDDTIAIDTSYALGRCYANGYGVKQDEEKAKQHYLRAEAIANQSKVISYSSEMSKLELATYYSDGPEKDEEKARGYYAHLHNSPIRNNPYVLVKEALFYAYCSDAKNHKEKVHQLLTQAVAIRDAQALYILGRYSMLGIHGVGRNPFKAFKLYQQASKQGHSQAMIELGLCYYHAYGTQKNEQKARYYFTKAANQNNAEANAFLSADAKALLISRNPHTAYQVIKNTRADDEKTKTYRQGREALEKMMLTETILDIGKLPSPYDYSYDYVYLLLNALQTNHSLSVLDLRSIILEEDALFSLSEILSRENSLRVLSLRTQPNLEEKALLALVEAMEKPSSELHTLKLKVDPDSPFPPDSDSSNDIKKQIWNSLFKTQLCTLHVENLACHFLDKAVIQKLKKDKKLTNLKLTNLLLDSSLRNGTAMNAFSILLHSLCGPDRALNKLELPENVIIHDKYEYDPDADDPEFFSLSTLVLLLQASNLTHLDLTSAWAHPHSETELLYSILDALSENETLTSLNLSNWFTSYNDSNLAIKAISSSSIENLIFEDNRINIRTLILLFQSQLCELILGLTVFDRDLAYEGKDHNNYPEVGEALSQNNTLTSLDLSFEEKNYPGISETLGKALPALQKLVYHAPMSQLTLDLLVGKVSILDSHVPHYCFGQENESFHNHLVKNKNLISFTNKGREASTCFTQMPIERRTACLIKTVLERNRSYLTAWQQLVLYNAFIQASPLSAHKNSIIPLFPIISLFMEYPAEYPLSFSHSDISRSRFFTAQLAEGKERRACCPPERSAPSMRSSLEI